MTSLPYAPLRPSSRHPLSLMLSPPPLMLSPPPLMLSLPPLMLSPPRASRTSSPMLTARAATDKVAANRRRRFRQPVLNITPNNSPLTVSRSSRW